MKLLHVYSGNLFGGIETILVTLARHRHAAPALDAEAALCFDGRLGRELAAAGMRVHPLGEVRVSRPQTIARARRSLAKLLASRRYDAVVMHAAWSHALFATVVRKAGVPCALWVHDVWTGRHWTERWARRSPPDVLICNSGFTAAAASAVFPDTPSEVVYAPVDVSSPPLSPADRGAVRREFETPADAVVIVQASRMDAIKGHAELIDALATLGDRPWIWWQIGGPQRPREEAYLQSIRERAKRRGIADRVRFVGERSDVGRLLPAADVHCQPNVAPESFGIAFVEALAAGLPVVTTNIGGAVEIVDASCGVLVPPRDTGALAHALAGLIDRPVERRRLSSAAPARARLLCDPDTQSARFSAVLARLADTVTA